MHLTETLMRLAMSYVVFFLGHAALAGCASSGADLQAGGGEADAGSLTTAEDAAARGTGAGPALDGATLVGDGGGSCGSSLDMHGCACTPGTPPRDCYPGPKSQAGVGVCKEGTQSCVATMQGEVTTGQWGPCQGAGQPSTCASKGAQCGSVSDGCGGVLSCGTCSGGLTCGAGGTPNVCGTGTCTPKTCAALGVSCGTASDGCTGMLDCGSCTAPQTCGGGGEPGLCGCSPTTCSAQGATCGTVADGCGGVLDCGSCSPPQTCGGGGTPNTCGQQASCPGYTPCPLAVPQCTSCWIANCCSAAVAYFGSVDGMNWLNCFLDEACTSPGLGECVGVCPPSQNSCSGNVSNKSACCDALYPAGAALEQAYVACGEAYCPSCG